MMASAPGIDTAQYEFRSAGREPGTVLFLGSFRHLPNKEALDCSWHMSGIASSPPARRPGCC